MRCSEAGAGDARVAGAFVALLARRRLAARTRRATPICRSTPRRASSPCAGTSRCATSTSRSTSTATPTASSPGARCARPGRASRPTRCSGWRSTAARCVRSARPRAPQRRRLCGAQPALVVHAGVDAADLLRRSSPTSIRRIAASPRSSAPGRTSCCRCSSRARRCRSERRRPLRRGGDRERLGRRAAAARDARGASGWGSCSKAFATSSPATTTSSSCSACCCLR